jgi:hypothetical protein
MRSYLVEMHGDLMRAVGAYHSHTRALNIDYQARVLAAARHMFASAQPTRPRAEDNMRSNITAEPTE